MSVDWDGKIRMHPSSLRHATIDYRINMISPLPVTLITIVIVWLQKAWVLRRIIT
jgi:hypothetical protein